MFLKADQNHDILCSYFNIKKAICQRIMSSATIKSISRYHLQDQMLSKYYEADADLPLLRRQFVSKTSAMRDEIFRGVLPSDPVKSVSGDSVAGANRCVFGDLWVLKQVFYGPLIKFNCLTSSHFTVKYQSLMRETHKSKSSLGQGESLEETRVQVLLWVPKKIVINECETEKSD